MGIITQTGLPAVQTIMRDIGRRLQGSHIVVGTTLGDVAEMQEKISWGYRFMNVGSPFGYGIDALQQHLATLRGQPDRPGVKLTKGARLQGSRQRCSMQKIGRHPTGTRRWASGFFAKKATLLVVKTVQFGHKFLLPFTALIRVLIQHYRL